MPKNTTVTQRSRSERGSAISLSGPNLLLPSQYYGQLAYQEQLTPEKKLLLGVLESAVYDIQRYHNARCMRERRLFHEAYAWFASEEDKSPFSFVAICHALEWDPVYIRKGVLFGGFVVRD